MIFKHKKATYLGGFMFSNSSFFNHGNKSTNRFCLVIANHNNLNLLKILLLSTGAGGFRRVCIRTANPNKLKGVIAHRKYIIDFLDRSDSYPTVQSNNGRKNMLVSIYMYKVFLQLKFHEAFRIASNV